MRKWSLETTVSLSSYERTWLNGWLLLDFSVQDLENTVFKRKMKAKICSKVQILMKANRIFIYFMLHLFYAEKHGS
jgi:hypothetical protein